MNLCFTLPIMSKVVMHTNTKQLYLFLDTKIYDLYCFYSSPHKTRELE